MVFRVPFIIRQNSFVAFESFEVFHIVYSQIFMFLHCIFLSDRNKLKLLMMYMMVQDQLRLLNIARQRGQVQLKVFFLLSLRRKRWLYYFQRTVRNFKSVRVVLNQVLHFKPSESCAHQQSSWIFSLLFIALSFRDDWHQSFCQQPEHSAFQKLICELVTILS